MLAAIVSKKYNNFPTDPLTSSQSARDWAFTILLLFIGVTSIRQLHGSLVRPFGQHMDIRPLGLVPLLCYHYILRACSNLLLCVFSLADCLECVKHFLLFSV